MYKHLLVWVAGLAAPLAAQSVPIFDDVQNYQGYYSHVNMMRLRFITTGCTYIPSNYCPNDNLTRGQAAVLIIRSIYSGSTGNPEGFPYNPYLPQYFSDVPSSHPQYVYIQKMAELGITSGCQTGLYCPDDSLNYAQIAVFAVRARMIKDYGYLFPLDCYAEPGSFANYPCAQTFSDVPPSEFFFPYVQKANQLIGYQSRAHDCWYGAFCPYSNVIRGPFAYYAVSLILNPASPSVMPNGYNLPAVLAPNNPAAGVTMSCEQAQNNLYTANWFVAVDANNVYAEAGTNFAAQPQSPSLWITYAWRQLTGPSPPYPATVEREAGERGECDSAQPEFCRAGWADVHTEHEARSVLRVHLAAAGGFSLHREHADGDRGADDADHNVIARGSHTDGGWNGVYCPVQRHLVFGDHTHGDGTVADSSGRCAESIHGMVEWNHRPVADLYHALNEQYVDGELLDAPADDDHHDCACGTCRDCGWRVV